MGRVGYVGWNLHKQGCFGRFEVMKKKIQKCLITNCKSIIKFVELNLFYFPRQSGISYSTSV